MSESSASRVLIRELALVDLEEQAGWIGRDRPRVALRFLGSAQETMAQLATLPGIGEAFLTDHPRLQGVRRFRVAGFPNHLIFYREIEGGIEVVRVLHGARDLPRALDEMAE